MRELFTNYPQDDLEIVVSQVQLLKKALVQTV